MTKKRLSALFLSILMLMSLIPIGAITSSAALVYGETVKVNGESSWITYLFQNFSGSGLDTSGGSFNSSAGMHIKFYLNDTSGKKRFAYCIQKGTTHHDGYQNVSDVYASFSDKQQKLMETALIYLYQGKDENGKTPYGIGEDIAC